MKKSIIILFNCIVIFFCGCKKEETGDIERIPLSFTSVDLKSMIGMPISACFIGNDSIVINDQKNNYMVRLYDIRTGDNLQNTCAVGSGPNEFMPPIRLTKVSNSIYVLDLITKKVYSALLDDENLTEIVQLPLEVMGLYYLPKHEIFIAPIMQFGEMSNIGNTFAYVYSKDFVKIQNLNGFALLWDKEFDLNDRILNKFHQVEGICEVGNNTIAILESHIIRLFTTHNGKISFTKDVLLFPYEYDSKLESGDLLPSVKLRDGFVRGSGDLVSDGKSILISVNTGTTGAKSIEKQVKLIQLDEDGNLLKEYIPTTLVKPYPMALSDKGKIVMISDREEDSLLISDYPN